MRRTKIIVSTLCAICLALWGLLFLIESQTAWYCTPCCLASKLLMDQPTANVARVLGTPEHAEEHFWSYPKLNLELLIDRSTRKVIRVKVTGHEHS